MGAELYFYANKIDREDAEAPIFFLCARTNRIGNMILKFFEPKNRCITLEAWNSLINTLLEEKELIDYLAGHVAYTFSFDEYIPERYRELDRIDLKRVECFKRWLIKEFEGAASLYESVNVSAFDMKECELVVTDAFILKKWLEMDVVVRRYLLDERYELVMGIG